MENKIFKHYTGDLSAFKTYIQGLNQSDQDLLTNSITFIHPSDSNNSGWLYANGKYYTANEVIGVSAEILKDFIDGTSIGVNIENDKLQLTPIVQTNITSNLQTAVGYINSGEISNVFTKGMTLDEVLKKIFCKVLDYTTSNTNTFNLVGTSTPQEVGSSYTPTISFTGAPTLTYNKPVGGSTAQTSKTLTPSNYTLTYAFGIAANPSTFSSTNSYTAPAWKVTEGSKTYYGVVRISNIATAASLGLKKSDNTTPSATTFSNINVSKNAAVTGAYKVYYVVNSTTKLTASSTFAQCVAACTTNKMLTGNITVIGDTSVTIGSSDATGYIYVLIPSVKSVSNIKNDLGGVGTMTVLKTGLVNSYNTPYTLYYFTANGANYKNLTILK